MCVCAGTDPVNRSGRRSDQSGSRPSRDTVSGEGLGTESSDKGPTSVSGVLLGPVLR